MNTIRATIDLWPQDDRTQAKRVAAVTITKKSLGCYRVEMKDNLGGRKTYIIAGKKWENAAMWALLNEATGRLVNV